MQREHDGPNRAKRLNALCRVLRSHRSAARGEEEARAQTARYRYQHTSRSARVLSARISLQASLARVLRRRCNIRNTNMNSTLTRILSRWVTAAVILLAVCSLPAHTQATWTDLVLAKPNKG